jgi:hypothetical protein
LKDFGKEVKMIRVAVAIVCATMFSAMCLAQNRPTLKRRDGPANPAIHGNLEGFRVVHKVWPTVKTNLPNGTRVTLTALVAHGKAVQVSVGNGDADPKAAEALAGAFRKWRFAMPLDGTSPVSVTLTWKAQDGKFVNWGVEFSSSVVS